MNKKIVFLVMLSLAGLSGLNAVEDGTKTVSSSWFSKKRESKKVRLSAKMLVALMVIDQIRKTINDLQTAENDASATENDADRMTDVEEAKWMRFVKKLFSKKYMEAFVKRWSAGMRGKLSTFDAIETWGSLAVLAEGVLHFSGQ